MIRRSMLLLNFVCLYGLPLLCLALLTHHTWYGPDIWYHLTWGRDVLERGSILPTQRSLFAQPISANLYWLFQLLIFGIFRSSGAVGLSAFFSFLWLAIGILWTQVARLSKAPVIVGPLALLGFIICAQLRFDLRPEVFAYALLLALLLLLTRIDASRPIPLKTFAALISIQALLVNSHGYFILGPLLGGAFLAALILRRKSVRELSRGASLFVALMVSTLLSPNGWRSWEIVTAYEKLGRAFADINAELFPTWRIALTFPVFVFWIFWAALLTLIIREIWKRGDPFAIVTAAAGLYLGATMFRNIPLCLILAAPLLGSVFEAQSGQWLIRFRLQTQIVYSLAAAVFAVVIVTGDYHRWTMSLATFGSGFERASYPIGAVEFLNKIGFRGRLFTDSYDGGYVEYQRPDLRIAGDSYFLDTDVTREFFKAIKEPSALHAAITRFQFDGLLINLENQEIVQSLWKNRDWVFSYADSHRMIFLRPASGVAPAASTATQKYYEGDDLTRWSYTFSPITWIQFALKINDIDLARKLLEDLRAAPQIPSTTVRGALLLAFARGDRGLAQLAAELAPKIFTTDPTDPDAIDKMLRNLR